MKHTKGNTPKCYECYFYEDKEPGDWCRLDGWCRNPYQCTHIANGKRRTAPVLRVPVMRGHECYYWEDAENRLTHFEVMTGKKEVR